MTAPLAPNRPAALEGEPWEARFRAPRTLWVRIAPGDQTRGLACSNVSGTYQLHRWTPGEPLGEALTTDATGKLNGWLSPDGKWVIWHADEAGGELGHMVSIPWTGGEPVDVTPDIPAYAAFAAGFGPDGTFGASIVGADRVQLAVIHAGGDRPGDLVLLDPGPGFVTNLAVGPAAPGAGPQRVAYSTTGGRGLATSLRVLDAATGELLGELDHAPGTVMPLAFAPTGRLLASTSRSGVLRPLLLDPGGEPRELGPDGLPGDLVPVSISIDGRTVLAVQSHRTAERLFVLDVETAEARPIDCVSGSFIGYVSGAGTFIRPDGLVVVTHEDATTMPEVVLVDPVADRVVETLLAAPDVPPSRPFRSVDIPSTDGATVQGWLATPDGDGPFPTVLDVHGGPQANESDRFFPIAQSWLDRGFAFLTLNYRGSTGFGRDYEQAIWGRVGRCELDDMVAAREHLVRKGVARPDAVVVQGGSYGGYLTLLALGRRPELWAAGVGYVAIADWRLLFEDGEPLREYEVALFEGTPDAKPDLYAEASPITYVDGLRAPLLIVQGRNDIRCPARQIEVYVDRARELGKPIEIDWFDAGHGHGGTETRIEWQRRAMAFIEGALGLAAADPASGSI